MGGKYHLLACALITWSPCVIFSAPADSPGPSSIEQTVHCVRDCMTRSAAPWPEEWKREYIETIRRAIEHNQDDAHYAERLEILRKEFGPYWESFTKTAERSLFEVHRARIRWYVEHLMGTEFPTEQEREKLRDQFTEIWGCATSSLLAQFAFLDPNAVQRAKTDDLNQCYQKINAPLLPVYLRPMSEQQVAQIKERWDKLRYARVDLWRRLGGASNSDSEKSPVSANPASDYELTKQSLSQLLGQVWTVVPQRPGYYLRALEEQAGAAKRLVQSKRQAQSYEQRLEKERSRQLLQTEHVSFLLMVLLETALCPEEDPSVVTQAQGPSEPQGKSAKGGDAYAIGEQSQEK